LVSFSLSIMTEIYIFLLIFEGNWMKMFWKEIVV
jgi:hypothetical protein